MTVEEQMNWTAFEGLESIASGDLTEVVLKVKQRTQVEPYSAVLIFDDADGKQLDVDFRGSVDEVIARLDRQVSEPASETALAKTPQGRGRPKLGVVGREVTLLPRHWAWLDEQPGGASVALRKLVEEAKRANAQKDRIRQAKESTYRFISVVAGNLEGFEETSRALFSGNEQSFNALIDSWPADVRAYARKLSTAAFESAELCQ